MTLVELVNALRTECGVSGPAVLTVQNLGATTENARLLSWIRQAWIDIQTSKDDWQFLRQPCEFTLTANQQTYTPTAVGLADFGNWKVDSFRCSSVGANYANEQLLNFMEYTTFRNLYQYGNMRHTTSRPVVVAVTPDKSLAFGAIPDQAYVITGEYYTQPKALTWDADTPAIPARFHMMIVYRAMMYYGGYEAAPEVLARGELEFKRQLLRLNIDQLPVLVSGPPLA